MQWGVLQGAVYHIDIVTAAVRSQWMTQTDVKAKQHGGGSLTSATYFQMGGRSIQLVRFTTVESGEIIYAQSGTAF